MIGIVTEIPGFHPAKEDATPGGRTETTGSRAGTPEPVRRAVAEVAAVLLAECPAGWRSAQVRHRRVGEFAEQDAAVELAERSHRELPAPEGARRAFDALRRAHAWAGEPGWYSARIALHAPDDVTVQTDSGEPEFTGADPSPADYLADAAELAGDAPPWLAELAGAADVAAGLGRTLSGLGLPVDAVQFGGPALGDGLRRPNPSDGVGAHWRVLRRGGRWMAVATGPVTGLARAVFDDPGDAAAFAIGRVVLTGARGAQVHRGTGPFAPQVDDPPLSLLRDLRTLVLDAGSRLDRLGDLAGTVCFLAGTPLPARSLPPELMARPSTRWIIHRPLEVLAGTAVPWFGQPGGGAAVVLPDPVAELVRVGVLHADPG